MGIPIPVEAKLDERTATAAGDRAVRMFADAGRDAGQQFSRAFKTDGVEQDLDKIGKKAKDAYDKSADAAGRLRAEEARLKELREQSASDSRIISQAERVERARRAEIRAIRDATDAYGDYERAAESAGRQGGDSFVDGIGGAGFAASGRDMAEEFAGGFAGSSALMSLGSRGGPIGLAVAGVAAIGYSAGQLLAQNLASGMASLQTQDLFRARLGIDPAAAALYGQAAGDSYRDGWGASVVNNLDALQSGMQAGLIPRDASAGNAEEFVSQINVVSDVTGMDPAEISRGARNFVKTGMVDDYQQAFDLIITGSQQGLDISGDLLDTMEEYGTVFQSVGLTGADSLGLINQLWEAGIRNTDVAADSIKELSISLTDGSEQTANALAALGFNAEDMGNRFAAGGPVARAALGDVITALRNTDDANQRHLIGLDLFKTKWEDAKAAIQAADLDTAAASLGDINGATRDAANAVSEHANQWDLLGRNMETTFSNFQKGLAETDFGKFFTQGIPGWINDLAFPPDLPQTAQDFMNQRAEDERNRRANYNTDDFQNAGAAQRERRGGDPLAQFGPERIAPVPLQPDSVTAGGAASLPGAPVLPLQYTSTAGMPPEIAAAQNRLDEVRHELAEKEARVNQLMATNANDADAIQKARNDVTKAENDELDATRQLQEAQINAYKQSTKQLQGVASGMDQIGAALDNDFGISEGLPGIAENLIKFVASLAAAPLLGQLSAISQAAGDEGSGIVGMMASTGALGPRFMPGAANLGPAALQPGLAAGYANPNVNAMMALAMGASGRTDYGPASDLINGLADCSGSISDLYEVLTTGQSTPARMFDTTAFASDAQAAQLGFRPGFMPGALNVGVNPYPGQSGHMAATLPNMVNFEGGGGTGGGAQYGGSAAGARDPQFEKQYYFPLGAQTSPSVPATAAPTYGVPDLYGPANTSPALTNPGALGWAGPTGLPTGIPLGGGGESYLGLPGGQGVGVGTAMGTGLQPPASGGGSGNMFGGLGMDAAMMAAGALNGLAPGAGAAAQIGIQLANRFIGYLGQVGGTAVSGVFETLSLGDNPMGSLGKSWFGKLAGGLAGARPSLPNMAGSGQAQPQGQGGGKAQDLAQRGGNTANISITNQGATPDQNGKDIAAHSAAMWARPGMQP